MSGLEHRYLEFMFFAYASTWVAAFAFLYRMQQNVHRMARDVEILKDNFVSETTLPSVQADDSPMPGPSV